MGTSGIIVPPVLYLPVDHVVGTDLSQTTVADLADGRKAIFAFTALDRLADCCGIDQGWILVPTDSLGRLQEELGFEVISIDKPIPVIATSQTNGRGSVHGSDGLGWGPAGAGSRRSRSS
ncbi:SAV_915 family protein [Mycetocola saprophilus]